MPELDSSRLARIETWMRRYVDERKFPGCTVLICHKGHEAYYAEAGFRDVHHGTSFSRDTIARVYSMTKPITSVVLMTLVEEGLVRLDAPLSDFVPEFSTCHALVDNATRLDQVEPCACPTLHQLLTHTSGLSYAFNAGLVPKAMEDRDIFFAPGQGPLADLAAKLGALPLVFQPGRRWEYSVGIDVIGRVIEVITGQSLDEVFQERIFDPLKITETAFSVPHDAVDRFASLYTPLEGNAMALGGSHWGAESLRQVDRPETSAFLNATLFSGGGGLVGTIDDYMRFAEMLRGGGAAKGGRILSPMTLDFMMRNHLPGEIASMGPTSFAEQPMDGMGFGIGGAVVLDPARARVPGSVGDFSWGGMASTFFWVDPVQDLSVVFFTQLSPSSSYPSRSELKALVHGALV